MDSSDRAAAVASALDSFYYRPEVQLLRRWWSEFGRLVLPTECAGCSAPDEGLCPGCRASLRRATARPYRAEAGAASLPFLDDCLDGAGPGMRDPQVLPVVAAGRYRHELALAVLAFKNHGRTDLAAVLAAALGRAVHDAAGQLRGTGPGPLLLVPVPARPRARNRRGYEPLGLLLRRLERGRLLPPGVVVLHAATVRPRPGAAGRAVAEGVGPVGPPSQRRRVHAGAPALPGGPGRAQLPAGGRCPHHRRHARGTGPRSAAGRGSGCRRRGSGRGMRAGRRHGADPASAVSETGAGVPQQHAPARRLSPGRVNLT
ncbi:hypothetical protein [Arthrobacter mobilis]|uniref:Amidophosphoribosyltransferase n=1 Tax=Arthrobacter mobilis TaxID=2724944 RepID=A0A7X6K5I1_9MICC|nr:hypothetical protein [Arthrobacter mobilis]NKX53825.1 hypothetical protein [Arthrobacter mobilis]